jgi:6-phosphogluconolactonase
MAIIVEKFFTNKHDLNIALSTSLELRLRDAITNNGRAVLMASGGSSPAPAYKHLSTLDLDWQHIDVGMVDERWVSPSHEKSNETFIKNTLLQYYASKANFLGMKNQATTAEQGLQVCENSYQALKRPFDVTILGMGPDGHTASLFPHAQGLDTALKTNQLVCAIHAIESEVTGSITERMSLSLNAIVQSKIITLLITGEEKLNAYQQAKQNIDGVNDMPLRAVLNHPDANIEVYWAP